VTENNQNSNSRLSRHGGDGPWWKPGMQIMSEVSTWIIVPIVLALVFGKMLDTHFGTKPRIFLVFAGLGFLATCLGIYRVMKNYIKKLKEIEKNSEQNKN
jgi:F0F1-type ATP synthase assembly protein I